MRVVTAALVLAQPAVPGALAADVAASSRCVEDRWVASWAADPSDASRHGDLTSFVDASANVRLTLRHQTVRTTLTPSLGGTTVRVRLSNRFGSAAVTFGHVAIAARAPDGAIAGPSVDLTFGGRQAVSAPAGQDVVSDPVQFSFAPMQPLSVSVYVPDAIGRPTGHLTARQTTFIGFDSGGDHVADRSGGAFPFRSTSRPFVSGLEVMAPGTTGTVVAFGDSLTDGYQGPPTLAPEDRAGIDVDGRYPDVLAGRLRAAGRPLGVVNAGISGNRVLRDTVDSRGGFAYGRAALTRFGTDALDESAATTLILFEGINDLAQTPQATPAELIGGYRELIARAHRTGLRVIQATLTPAGTLGGGIEAARREVNAWIRTQSPADAVVDFDAVVRDPADGARLRSDYDGGDGLHLSLAGYRALGGAVPLDALRDPSCLDRLTAQATPTRVRPGRPTLIRVTVLREGRPAAGARVKLGVRQATTSAGGVARLRVRLTAPGLRQLRVTAAGAEPVTLPIRVLRRR